MEESKTLKLEDVAIFNSIMIKIDKIENLNNFNLKNLKTFKPFEKNIIDFLQDFSNYLIKDKKNINYPEIIAFAFWIRKSNLIKIEKNLNLLKNETRIGRGLAFHVPPANVITGFLYSWVFGLLSGNSNIVKVSSNNKEFNSKIIKLINKIFSKKKYHMLLKNNFFVSYSNDESINEFMSINADCRLIWGGDQTVNKFKHYKTQIKNIDLFFSDRYSFSLIRIDDKTDLNILTDKFYNDAFLMDQNACSSPHLIVWYKTKQKNIENFWKILEKKTNKNYQIDIGNAFKKFESKINNLMNVENFLVLKSNGSSISRVEIKKLQKNIDELRGKFGQFFEYKTENMKFLKRVDKKYQTLSVYGINKDTIINKIISMRLCGIDRVVDIGNANSITLLWDGYDVVRSLSRIINNE